MIALIDYGMGNLLSVYKALEYAGAKLEVTGNASDIAKADAVILPSVGNIGGGMENLYSRNLAKSVLDAVSSGKPFLGICLGMQMLMEASEEAPGVKGLSIFKGRSIKFPQNNLKVPHMGWNNIKIQKNCPCLSEVADNSYFYFVHSYYVQPDDKNVIGATCDYGLEFAAALSDKNIFATQFHPEKSQDNGLAILRSFVKTTVPTN